MDSELSPHPLLLLNPLGFLQALGIPLTVFIELASQWVYLLVEWEPPISQKNSRGVVVTFTEKQRQQLTIRKACLVDFNFLYIIAFYPWGIFVVIFCRKKVDLGTILEV